LGNALALPITAAESRPSVKIVCCDAEWETLREDWNALYAASPGASTPLDFRWLRQWWTSYAGALTGAGLRIVTLWRGSELIGVLPLYVRRERLGPFAIQRLGFLSTGEAEVEETCPDYLNLLCRAGEEAICSDAAWRAIEAMSFDHMELLNIPEGALVQSAAAPRGLIRNSRGACLIADLNGGFDAYLKRLSANSRQNARRLIREAERAGVQFELAEAAQADEVFVDLIRLHQARWTANGQPGAFAAPRFVAFHRAMVSHWMRDRRVVLARMSLAKQPVAILYGFVTGTRFDFYQSGIRMNDSCPLRSPGTLAHLLLMRALVGRGITAYDFLSGSAPYKARLTTSATGLLEIGLWRTTVRSVLFRSAAWGGRALQRGVRLLLLLLPGSTA
jgi:CelD/BcsL family acetyltransferase involved in cellulose biosynthesis